MNLIKKSLLCLSLLIINSCFLMGMDFMPKDDGSLYWAISLGNVEMAKERIKQGANVNGIIMGGIPLLGVALLHSRSDNQAELVKLLLENGADINMNNRDLMIISGLQHLDPRTVQILLAYGLNLYQENMSAERATKLMGLGSANRYTTMLNQLEQKRATN